MATGVVVAGNAGNTVGNTTGNDSLEVVWATKQATPERTGYAPTVAPPANNPATAWKAVQNDAIASSPAVANDAVYVGSETKGRLYALNSTDGTEIWTFDATGNVQSPTLANGAVYVGDANGELYALDSKSGSLLWNRSLGTQIVGSPAVVDGHVFATAANDGGSDVWALDADTGVSQWQYTVSGNVGSAPAVGDGNVFVSAAGNVHALGTSAGNVEWTTSLDSSGGLTTPTVGNDAIFVVDRDSASESGTVYALGTETGNVAWTTDTSVEPVGSAAIAHGTVYVSASDSGSNQLIRLDAQTGSASPATKPYDVRTAPVLAEKTVFAGTADGLLAMNASTGDTRYFHEVPDDGTPSVASAPAIGNEAVYFGLQRTNDSVYKVSGEDFDYAPEAVANHAPTDPVKGESVTFDGSVSSDFDGEIVTYEWDFDGDSTFEKTGSTVEHAFASAGNHEVTLRVTDDSGVTDTTRTTVTVLEPASLSVTDYSVSNTNVTLDETITVEAAVENTGDVEGSLEVSLYEDGWWQGSNTVTVAGNSAKNVSFTTSFTTTGNHSLSVDLLPRTNVTVRDETPPTAPLNVSGPTWANETATVLWETASDNAFIDYYEVQVDDGTWTDDGSATATRLSGLTNGTHEVSVRAVDTGGNVGPANNTTIRVDTIAPSAGNVATPDGWVDDTVPVSWGNVTDNESGVDYYEVRKDGGPWITGIQVESYEFSFGFGTTGEHTVSVRGVDETGNPGAVSNATVLVDRTSANISIDAWDNGTYVVNITDNRSGIRPGGINLTLDGEQLTNATVVNDSVVYRGTVDGGYHDVKWTITDVLDNTGFGLSTFRIPKSSSGSSGGSGGSSGGGGGGGGSDLPPPPVNAEITEQDADHVRAKITSARADSPGSVSLSGLESGQTTFREVRVKPASEDAQARFFVEATSVDSPDAAAVPSDETLGYLRTSTTYIENDELAGVTVEFRVPTDAGRPEDVSLYRYRDGEWQSVATEFVGKRDGKYAFRGSADGSALFAVGVTHTETTTATATTTTTAVTTTNATTTLNGTTEAALGDATQTATGTTDATGTTPGFGPVVAVVALAGAVLAARRRE